MIERLDDGMDTALSPAGPPSAAEKTPGSATTVRQGAQSRPSSRAVQVTALVREFGSPSNPIRAVDNLDLQVHTGEIYGFLGPNGAGKTTLARMRPTSGSALVAGYDVVRQADDVRRSIAWRSRRRRSTRS